MKSKIVIQYILILGMVLLMSTSCQSKEDHTIQSKEELFLKVKEMQPELGQVVEYMKELDKDVVITNTKDSLSEEYYLDFDNSNLGRVVEAFSVNGLTRFEELDWRREYTNFDCDKTFKDSKVVYWGFYYAEEDEPITWGGTKKGFPLKPEGDGYVAQYASIYYYTEKIIDHWYYFAYD